MRCVLLCSWNDYQWLTHPFTDNYYYGLFIVRYLLIMISRIYPATQFDQSFRKLILLRQSTQYQFFANELTICDTTNNNHNMMVQNNTYAITSSYRVTIHAPHSMCVRHTCDTLRITCDTLWNRVIRYEIHLMWWQFVKYMDIQYVFDARYCYNMMWKVM